MNHGSLDWEILTVFCKVVCIIILYVAVLQVLLLELETWH